jgi:protein transport protein SEC61 subunit gamma and related proteins
MKLNLKESLANYARVLKIASKPDYEDFSESVKVCFIGIMVVGIIGFFVYMFSTAVL